MMVCFSASRIEDELTASVTEEQVVEVTEWVILTTYQGRRSLRERGNKHAPVSENNEIGRESNQ